MTALLKPGAGEVVAARFPCTILDVQAMHAAKKVLFALIAHRPACTFLLSFRKVQYLNTATLGTLIALHKTLSDGGGRLVLCNLDPHVHEIIQRTRLEKFFNIEERPEAEKLAIEFELKISGPTAVDE